MKEFFVFYLFCAFIFQVSHAAVDGIIATLPLSDINIVIVTDVHSWVGGHVLPPTGKNDPPPNPNAPLQVRRTADYGDVLSFVEHLKSYMATQHEKDVWFVMNGDWIDGTGLAMNGNADSLIPILEKMNFDAVTVGNHELYRKSIIEQMLKPAGFIEFLGHRYVSSNVMKAERSDSSIGNTYTILRGKYSNLLVFGFLYEMGDNDDAVVVQKVQKTVQSAWFQAAVMDTSSYHAILVLAHMDVRDHLIQTIITAIRKIAGPDMPVQFVTGHTHRRDVEIIDDLSVSVEAGRYLDTVGFVSFPSTKSEGRPVTQAVQDIQEALIGRDNNATNTNVTNIVAKTPAPEPSLFQHVFIDATPVALKKALGMAIDFDLRTPNGDDLSRFIKQIQLDLGLNKVIGWTCDTYFLDEPIWSKNSLWGFFQREVVPSQAMARDQAVLLDNGQWRYDVLYEGDVRFDDVIGISPFNSSLLLLEGVEMKALLEFNETYNTEDESDLYKSNIPKFVLSFADPSASFDTVDVMVDSFEGKKIIAALQAYNSVPLEPPKTTNVTTTSIWLDYFAKEGYNYCKSQGKNPPKSHFEKKKNPFGESNAEDAIDVTFGVVAIAIILVLCAAMVHQKSVLSRRESNAKEFVVLQAQQEYNDASYHDDEDISDEEYGAEGRFL